MTRTNSMLIRWRVQYRIVPTGKWRNAGLFETRDVARIQAGGYRNLYGFGNTRVVRHLGKGK